MEQVLYPQQGKNFDTLKKDKGISQRKIKEIAGVTDKTVSDWCQGKKQISRTNAQSITIKYPEYTIEFLRGETPFRNKGEEAAHIVARVADEGNRLEAAVLILAELSGFTIARSTIERTGEDVIDAVHEYTCGYDLTRQGKRLHLSMHEMGAIENYICDLVELTLDRLLITKGNEDGEGR